MRVGILGGSFNPPHRGHLALAQTVLDAGLADRVRLIPAATPPHKIVSGGVDAPSRLAMTRLLAREDGRIDVDDIELERAGLSYTIDTLRELIAENPGTAYRLIIGSDLAKTFATWREYREILRLAPPLVAERPDDPFRGDEEYPGMAPGDLRTLAAGRFDMRPVDVSSTKIRRLVAEGAGDATLSAYLTAPVLAFVRERRLYLDDE
ncbi:MAG: nicotinate (nicotinamide) nucleotide adenylyltransferase [Planctomycetota bacterium]|jgi:nicotinate-nucleotide adenylyltransferase|nr:nicotinate (nicotinamide) nucleotide adenylyltransferase [Planctomycetota bacterium]